MHGDLYQCPRYSLPICDKRKQNCEMRFDFGGKNYDRSTDSRFFRYLRVDERVVPFINTISNSLLSVG